MAGAEDMWKTRTLWPPLVTLHLFFHSHYLNLHFSFLVPQVKNFSWVQLCARWSRELTSVPVDEAGETDRDQVKVVAVFALCLIGAMVVDRAACPPPLYRSDRIRSTTGTSGRCKGKREVRASR